METTTNGLPDVLAAVRFSRASAIPQTAWAAAVKMERDSWLSPATSTIEGIITMSLVPT